MKEETGGRAGVKTGPAVGDRLKLRKSHPCGGTEFEVVRTGMDIRLRCLTCGSQIVLSRRKLEKMTAGRGKQAAQR
jgi:Uncharacterized protein conserved in bacteria